MALLMHDRNFQLGGFVLVLVNVELMNGVLMFMETIQITCDSNEITSSCFS